MKNIWSTLGLLALVLIVAPLCVVLYGVLAVAGGVVRVILWPTKAVLGVVGLVLGGGVREK